MTFSNNSVAQSFFTLLKSTYVAFIGCVYLISEVANDRFFFIKVRFICDINKRSKI